MYLKAEGFLWFLWLGPETKSWAHCSHDVYNHISKSLFLWLHLSRRGVLVRKYLGWGKVLLAFWAIPLISYTFVEATQNRARLVGQWDRQQLLFLCKGGDQVLGLKQLCPCLVNQDGAAHADQPHHSPLICHHWALSEALEEAAYPEQYWGFEVLSRGGLIHLGQIWFRLHIFFFFHSV